jgi:hypothetical protein
MEVFLYRTFACYRLVVVSRIKVVWFVASYLPRSPFVPSFLDDCPFLKPKPKLPKYSVPTRLTYHIPSPPLFLYLFIISSTLNILVFNF